MRDRRWHRYAIPFRDMLTEYRPSLDLLFVHGITLDVLLHYVLREWIELETSIWRYADTRTMSPYEAVLSRFQMDFLEGQSEIDSDDHAALYVITDALIQEVLSRLFLFSETILEHPVAIEVQGQASIRFDRIAGQQAIVEVFQ